MRQSAAAALQLKCDTLASRDCTLAERQMPIGILLLAAGAIFYYRVGQLEYGAGFVTAGLSIVLWLITWMALGWGWFGYVAGQLVLLGGLTWYNMQRRAKS